MSFSVKDPGLLLEVADSKVGEGIYKMSMNHLVMPEGKEVLKNKNNWYMSKGPRNMKETQLPNLAKFEKPTNNMTYSIK